MSAIYVEITATRGSTPRDAGTAMKVTAETTKGTIGGGALEHQAIALARTLLATDAPDTSRTIPLGPNLGQCCGGSVTLLFTRQERATDMPRHLPVVRADAGPPRPLWIWGAGHVGRAIVDQAAPTCAFDISWIDSSRARFPAEIPKNVTVLPTPDMPRIVPFAPRQAAHLILTYSHDIDLALCAALLAHGFGFCGLIGSATKWTRFRKRLQALSLDPRAITCPIGDPALGKHPDSIASGTVQALLSHFPQKETA